MAMKIMIVEDDETLSGEISSFLRRWGYDTAPASSFDRILDEFTWHRPNLVLMDVNLPYYDGFYWCGKIRQVSQVPILYISSRSDDKDKIMAMAQGGDDYVEKPFHLEVLRAKIWAMLRRTYEYKVKEQAFLGGGLSFDWGQQALRFEGEEIGLTKSERRVVVKLIENSPGVVTREELMVALWETDEYVSDGTLTTMISRLRGKLKSVCGRDVISTKKGLGYCMPCLPEPSFGQDKA